MAYGATFHKSARTLADEGPAVRLHAGEPRAGSTRSSQRYPPDRRALGGAAGAVSRAVPAGLHHRATRCATSPSCSASRRADVEDVVSYYTMFYTRPVGKFVINVCRTLSCALNGAERVTEELRGKLGIAPGETDAGGTFTLMEVECLGACDRAPVGDGQRRVARVPDAGDVPASWSTICARAAKRRCQRLSSRRSRGNGHEPGLGDRRIADGTASSPKYVREPNSFTLDFYLQHGGYDGAEDGARARRPTRSSSW